MTDSLEYISSYCTLLQIVCIQLYYLALIHHQRSILDDLAASREFQVINLVSLLGIFLG